MARQRDLDKLLSDLRSFLLILDRESLSAGARAKKKSVAELLSRLQSPSSEDAEYMIMRCLSPAPGTSQGWDGQASSPAFPPGTRRVDGTGGRGCECPPASTLSLPGGSKVVSPSSPPEDSYEDNETPSPSRCAGSGGADTDSSHYESYEEDEDGVMDRAHYLRWSAAPSPDADPPGHPEAQLCGFLWRRRWLGQWVKQLFIVRENVLLCFRCAADPHPVLVLDLRGCCVTYKAKRGKKMPHALKVTGTAGEVLVIGFQSQQQAEDWRKVIAEVSSNAPGGLAAIGVPVSPSSRLSRAAVSQLSKEKDEACPGEDAKGGGCGGWGQTGPGAVPVPVSRLTGAVPAGFLAVRLRWQRLWRAVRDGALRMAPGPGGGTQPPGCALRLQGCQVSPGAASGSPRHLHIRIAQRGRELTLQTRPDEEREAWLKTLRARGGGEMAGGSPGAEPPRLGDASSCPAAGGLLLRRVPTPNTYMDDPFGQLPPPETPKHIYSNMERLQQLQSLDRVVQRQRRRPVSALPSPAAPAAAMRGRDPQRSELSPELRSTDLSLSQRTLTLPERKGARDGLDILIGSTSKPSLSAEGCLTLGKQAAGLGGARAGNFPTVLAGKRAFPKLEEKVGQLERGSPMKGRLKAGSEMNLLAISKSLRGHIAATTTASSSSAGSEQGSFLKPLLKRTASARSALRPPPSPLLLERGKVLQRRKEWEMKSAM
ncbi:actin filament-associated protein 1-like 2 isoform X3 [Calypte anna]|uniref:actin filament-associated protein 1-like 2 isoform X3 n=1 Tax=Calypte anna TaxID=9244 RepID=UPI0011C3FD11|nr:actin filament-associated protein 1-like 2 isoform X3 [Calypte anna]